MAWKQLLQRARPALRPLARGVRRVLGVQLPSWVLAPFRDDAFDELLHLCREANGNVLYETQIAAIYLQAWQRHEGQRHDGQRHGSRMPARSLQIGPGRSLGVDVWLALCGVREAVSLDPYPILDFDAASFLSSLKLLSRVQNDLNLLSGAQHPLLKLPEQLQQTGKEEYRVGENVVRRLAGPALENTGLPAESFDFVYSNAVLEHVLNPASCAREVFRLLQSGGLSAHQIDLRDHRNFADPLAFLREPEEQWQRSHHEFCRESPGRFMNRWRAGQYRETLVAAGLEIVEWRTTERLHETQVKCERARLLPQYADLSEEDIATLGLFVVVRKPWL